MLKKALALRDQKNCNAATLTTRQCNNNDKNNNIKERLVWSG